MGGKGKRREPSPRRRFCQMQRMVSLGAGLLITLSGLAIKTYFTTMQTADAVTETRADLRGIQADLRQLLRSDAAQNQRERDGELDRDRLRTRVQRLEDRGRNGER